MALAKVNAAAVVGLDGRRIEVEVDISSGLPGMTIVGLPDIEEWEETGQGKLNKMDRLGMLTTLPSVYNVMAMHARPRKQRTGVRRKRDRST